MIVDSKLVPQALAAPRSFIGLMALYESNYLRLLRLVPELSRLDGCFRSRVAGDCDLSVDIIERCRYTVTLSMTYRLPIPGGFESNPDMTVRAYLDGGLAEVLEIGKKLRHDALRRLLVAHKDEVNIRWRRNMILNKWLDYLVDQGHLILDR